MIRVNLTMGEPPVLTFNGNFGGGPKGIAVDGNGNIYVSNNPPEIIKVNPVTVGDHFLREWASHRPLRPFDGTLPPGEVYTDANAGSGKTLAVNSYMVIDGNGGKNQRDYSGEYDRCN